MGISHRPTIIVIVLHMQRRVIVTVAPSRQDHHPLAALPPFPPYRLDTACTMYHGHVDSTCTVSEPFSFFALPCLCFTYIVLPTKFFLPHYLLFVTKFGPPSLPSLSYLPSLQCNNRAGLRPSIIAPSAIDKLMKTSGIKTSQGLLLALQSEHNHG